MAAVASAAQLMREGNRLPASLAVSFIQLLAPRYRPSFADGVLNPAIVEDLRAGIQAADIAVSCMGGNAHSIFGLLNHPQPYDFSFNGEPLMGDRRIVSRGLVRAALKEQMRASLKVFAALRTLIDRKMIHCESPPPIPSESHIRAHSGIFAKRIGALGVAPAGFRLKLWKLQSDIFREFCAANDIEFLPAPAAVFGEDGMLSPKAWGADPTHGNAWYGEQVISQLASHVSAGVRQRADA